MIKTQNCSLVTPTYNWPEALELLLLSVQKQSVLPNEVIIADDGSTKETRALIQRFQQDFPVPIVHVWHEDEGNQKPKIMNKAIAKARYPYIVEIDGDIIMHRDFIKDHLNFSEKGIYLFGSRVNIQQEILAKIVQQKKIGFHLFSKGIQRRSRTLRIPLFMKFAKAHEKRSRKLRGCNMSFWRDDFIAVNGFNEALKGWGNDDSELIERFHNTGIKGKRLKHCGIAYHIYHPVQDKSTTNYNKTLEKATVEKQLNFITQGVNQYL